MRAHSFTVKATDFCNLACDYCYSPNSVARNIIRTDLLDALAVHMASDFSDDTRFMIVWHGSEPMSVGRGFFENVCNLFANSLGNRVHHHIQSNLTLLDRQWCEFLGRQQISVSTSIDGPRHVHDLHRVNRFGRGSFDKVISGLLLLREYAIPTSAIAVLTKELLPYSDELFDIATRLSLTLRVNPVLLPEADPRMLGPEAYGEFVIALARRYLETSTTFDLEPLRSMALRLVSGVNLMCDQETLCFSHLTGMGTDGSLYPCNRFVGVATAKIGEIGNTSLSANSRSHIAARSGRRHIDNEKCKSCEIVSVCNGGCMYHSYAIFGDQYREDYFCHSYVSMTKFLIDNLAGILRLIDSSRVDPSLAILANSAALTAPAYANG